LISRYLYRNRDQFELFQALAYTKTADIIEQKIHNQLHNLENEIMFKSVSELEDTNQYIENVMTEIKQSANTKKR
jgi:hypothetical protein